MNPNECLKRTYVRLRYVPPQSPRKPIDCRRVRISKTPEIMVFVNQKSHLGEPVGIDFHCALPFTQGVGGVHLIVQVSTFIEWEIEFMAERVESQACLAPWARDKTVNPLANVTGQAQSFSHPPNMQSVAITAQTVRETHRIYVSIPVAFTLSGTQIMLSSALPLKFRVAQYTVKILAAYKKLKEVEQIMELVTRIKNGFCPNDIKLLEESLKMLESRLDALLRQSSSGSNELAYRNNMSPNESGRFVGDRLT